MRALALALSFVVPLALPTGADARPEGFVEGVIGVNVALGDAGYLEERNGLSPQGGVRGGVLWRDGAKRRWGFDLGVDRTSFASDYRYYVFEADGITLNPYPRRPEYDRTRFLLSGRLLIQPRRHADLLFRAGLGVDWVTGDMQDAAPLMEVAIGGGLVFGRVRIGFEGTLPMAFHNAERADWPGVTEPASGRRIGYLGSVDLAALFTVGSAF